MKARLIFLLVDFLIVSAWMFLQLGCLARSVFPQKRRADADGAGK